MAQAFDAATAAKQIAELAAADLQGTMAIFAGLLQGIREDEPARLPAVKPGATALRVEMDKWYRAYRADAAPKDDPMAVYRDAGKAARG